MTDRTERARRIIADTMEVPLFEVLDWTPIADLCRDSVDWLDLMYRLETEFDVELRHDNKEHTCVGDIFRVIEKAGSPAHCRTGASVPVLFMLVSDPV